MKRCQRWPRYYLFTWDPAKQDFTPEPGVRCGPYTLFGLRKAFRNPKLSSAVGGPIHRDHPSVLVERKDEPEGDKT